MRRAIIGLAAVISGCAPSLQAIGDRGVGEHHISDSYLFEQRGQLRGETGRATYEQLGHTGFDFFDDGVCDSWRIEPGKQEDRILLIDGYYGKAVGELVRVPTGAQGMRVQYTNNQPVLLVDYGESIRFYANSKKLEFTPKPCK